MAVSDRSQVLQANERIKHASAVATAWANAVVIAAVGRLILTGKLDLPGILWIFAALMTIWAASHSLTLLEAEPKDG